MTDVISSTILRNNLAVTLKEVNKKRDYLLVAKKGKLVSALVNLDFFENLLALTSTNYLNSIRKARREYKKGEVFTHEEAFGEI